MPGNSPGPSADSFAMCMTGASLLLACLFAIALLLFLILYWKLHTDFLFEIQQADGSPVGNIHSLTLSGGAPPVGISGGASP